VYIYDPMNEDFQKPMHALMLMRILMRGVICVYTE
jgi:hypothetical protein